MITKIIGSPLSQLQQGVDLLSSAVASTLGPRGRSVVIEKPETSSFPQITKDGVTVARNINLPSGVQRIGAEMLKQASIQTDDKAGDGTTSTVLLGQSILKEFGQIQQQLQNVPITDVTTGLQTALSDFLAEIDKQSQMPSEKELQQVANVAANDNKLGQLIYESGKYSYLQIQHSDTNLADELIETRGVNLQNGAIHAYFGEGKLANPIVLLADIAISDANVLKEALELAFKEKRPLVVIAADVSGDALNTLVVNNVKGTVRSTAVRSQGYGNVRKQHIQDLVAITSAELLQQMNSNDDSGSIYLAKNGVKTVDFGPRHTNLELSEANLGSEAVINRTQQLKKLINSATGYERTVLEQRLANLAARGGILKLSAQSDVEFNEKKDRATDAIKALRAARSGVIVGGGKSYVNVMKVLEAKSGKIINKTEKIGYELLVKSLPAVLNALSSSCGRSGDYVFEKLANEKPDFGLDVRKNEFADLRKAGILDPTAVVKQVAKSAVSCVCQLISVGVAVVGVENKEKKPQFGYEDYM